MAPEDISINKSINLPRIERDTDTLKKSRDEKMKMNKAVECNYLTNTLENVQNST